MGAKTPRPCAPLAGALYQLGNWMGAKTIAVAMPKTGPIVPAGELDGCKDQGGRDKHR